MHRIAYNTFSAFSADHAERRSRRAMPSAQSGTLSAQELRRIVAELIG